MVFLINQQGRVNKYWYIAEIVVGNQSTESSGNQNTVVWDVG